MFFTTQKTFRHADAAQKKLIVTNTASSQKYAKLKTAARFVAFYKKAIKTMLKKTG